MLYTVYLYLYICISVHGCTIYVCILLCCIEIILKKNLNYLVNTQHTGLCHIDLFLGKDFRLQKP